MDSAQKPRKYRKLTAAEKVAIRFQYAAGARQVDLAETFGVDQSTISRVLTKKEAA